MPPIALWFQGAQTIRAWLEGRGSVCRNSRLVPITACGTPAFAQYHLEEDGRYSPWAIILLDIQYSALREMNFFLDTDTLFPRFGLPAEL